MFCLRTHSRIDPSSLPEGSPIRKALEDGRPDVAAWLAKTYPSGGQLYLHSEVTHRRCVFEDEARTAVEAGEVSARAAARRYGVPRGRLAGAASGG